MILVVFHIAGINEKKIYIYHEKKNVQNLKWATAHLSRRLGAGREGVWQALQAAGRAGARRSGRAELAGARQAERTADGARGRLGER